jgi:hypothetical protein
VGHIRPTRRDLVGGALSLAASAACAPAGLAEQRTILNDASRLNPTPVAKHWPVRIGERDEFIARLRSELAEAAVVAAVDHADASLVSMGRWFTVARSEHSGIARKLYAGGAWFVWPAIAGTCLSAPR